MAATKESKDRHPCRIRGITVDWPEPPVPFQEIEFGWTSPKFPALLVPWNGGRQIIYSTDDRQTYFKKLPPAWWIYPNCLNHLAGEEYRPNMGAAKLMGAWVYNSRNPNSDGIQIDAATWLINDVYLAGQTANQRAYAMVNLGPQPEGAAVAKVYQVNSTDTFNQYLESFQAAGFQGALVRDLNAKYEDPQAAVINPL